MKGKAVKARKPAGGGLRVIHGLNLDIDDGELVVLVASARPPLPGGLSVAEGREVNDGIHPESLRPADEDIAGTVAVVEPTGSETHVMLRAGGNAIMAVFRDRVSVMPVPGARLALAPDARTVHLFDQASGMRF